MKAFGKHFTPEEFEAFEHSSFLIHAELHALADALMVTKVKKGEWRGFFAQLRADLRGIANCTVSENWSATVLAELRQAFNETPDAYVQLRSKFISEVVRCGRELCDGKHKTQEHGELLAELVKIMHESDPIFAAVIRDMY
jgi:hypothetical protein